MRLVLSSPVPAGHLVLARLPESLTVVADLTVPHDGEPVTDRQDVTDWFADLVLLGLAAEQERQDDAAAGGGPDVEMVEVGRVELVGDPAALEHAAVSASVVYVYVPGGEAREVDLHRALELAAIGVRTQLTAGVAYEATEAEPVPDTPEGTENPR